MTERNYIGSYENRSFCNIIYNKQHIFTFCELIIEGINNTNHKRYKWIIIYNNHINICSINFCT
ncbi:hypothetical protein PFFVO_03837 [Plasmodium falciparum Vietnam Oak-Knoll (FVO)]|uniref:Uncharacterized protein n=1 Tax=Plasmodium falciparum Vietnam Oak-Knoll (FVO) TaxID=1036723 RepID=A0A024V4Y2_PLAFA|nr:hypothetical protein PFFVO_03837 [Plasmodium falciparum Vietnam Oak-Knoll (FVO)]